MINCYICGEVAVKKCLICNSFICMIHFKLLHKGKCKVGNISKTERNMILS